MPLMMWLRDHICGVGYLIPCHLPPSYSMEILIWLSWLLIKWAFYLFDDQLGREKPGLTCETNWVSFIPIFIMTRLMVSSTLGPTFERE